MSTHTALLLSGFVANALLACFILSRDARAAANRLYAVFASMVAYWAILKFALAFSRDADEARFWYRLSAPGWTFLPVVYLHFVRVYTGRKVFGEQGRYAFAAGYGLAAALALSAWRGGLIVSQMIPCDWGFTHVPGPLYRFVFAPYLLAAFIYALFHLVVFTVRAVKPDDRAKGALLIGGILAPVVGGGATNMILPALGIHLPELAIPLATVNALAVAYAMMRYRFLSLTAEYAASTIITTMPDSLIVLDRKGRIGLVNPAALALTAYAQEELVGREVNGICHEKWFNEELREVLERQGVAKLEVNLLTKAQAMVPVSLSASPLRDKKNGTVGFVCVAKDIRDIKRLVATIEEARSRLEKIAITDPLTGLFNRRYLELKLKEEYLRGIRYGSSFSVVVMDLDHFKNVNDTLGHSVGDALLCDVGAKLRNELRATDIVTRYGGDEFVLILPEAPAPRAIEVSQRLKQSVEKIKVQQGDLGVSASFGVSTFSPGRSPESEEILLRWADSALYKSKRMGRNRITHWDSSAE